MELPRLSGGEKALDSGAPTHVTQSLPAPLHETMLVDMHHFRSHWNLSEESRRSLHALHSVPQQGLDQSQASFLTHYYQYMQQATPRHAKSKPFDEKMFPVQACTEEDDALNPMQNSIHDDISQQLLLTFLHERMKRTGAPPAPPHTPKHSTTQPPTRDPPLDYKSLSQTATFLKEYFAPNHKSHAPPKKQPSAKRRSPARPRTTEGFRPSKLSSPSTSLRSKSNSRASTAVERSRTHSSAGGKQREIPSRPPHHTSNDNSTASHTSTFTPRRGAALSLHQAPSSRHQPTNNPEEPSPISLTEHQSSYQTEALTSHNDGLPSTILPQHNSVKPTLELQSQSENSATHSEDEDTTSTSSTDVSSHYTSKHAQQDDLPHTKSVSSSRSKLPLSEDEIGKISRRTTESKKSRKRTDSKSKKKKKERKSRKKSSVERKKSKKRKKRHKSATSKGADATSATRSSDTKKSKQKTQSAASSATPSTPLGLTIDSITLPPRGSTAQPQARDSTRSVSLSASTDKTSTHTNSKTVTIDLESSPDHHKSEAHRHQSNTSSSSTTASEKKSDELLVKIDRLLDEIDDQKSSNKKVLIDLLHLIENRSNQMRLVRHPRLLDFMCEKINLNSDSVMQLFAARCVLKLSFSKANREQLLDAGFMKTLVHLLCNLINIPPNEPNTFSPKHFVKRNASVSSNLNGKSGNKLIREILKSLHLFCKLGAKSQTVIEDSQLIECTVRLIRHEELKSQKIALRCLCSAMCNLSKAYTNSPRDTYNALLVQIVKLGAVEPLFSMLKNASANNVQKDALQTLCFLSENEMARDEIYNKGVFHSFLWLMRSENEDIQELSLRALSHFVPSDNVHVDSVVLKYGLDLLVQFFIESFNRKIVRASTRILAHMSEYARIHILLLNPAVLKQTFSLLLEDDPTVLKSTMFGAHVILSNLSKFKEGQSEIHRLGGVGLILKSLGQIAERCKRISLGDEDESAVHQTREEDDMSATERQLLPKVITRTIANLSGSAECQSKITNDNTLSHLIDLARYSGERTVVWNVLCCISNLCDQPHNQRKIICNKAVTDCLHMYLTQKDDEKLLSRAIRCIAILSKNVHIQAELERLFDTDTVLSVCRDVVHSEIQLDSLRFISNLSHNYDFHDKICQSSALKFVIKTSYFPLHVFHVEVARCLYNLSQNAKCRPHLVEEGAVSSLMRLQSESKHEKVKRYCENALNKF